MYFSRRDIISESKNDAEPFYASENNHMIDLIVLLLNVSNIIVFL